MNKRRSVSQDKLKELLHYNPDTGIFTWIKDQGKKVKAGDVAGCKTPTGYISIGFCGVRIRAHRLAFIFMEGGCPEFCDHINGCRHDNRWLNLRVATKKENCRNVRSHKDSSSRYLGVGWCNFYGKWRARIYLNGKTKHLGYFHNEEEAARSYDGEALKNFGEFANLNFGEKHAID